jgi:hypothetical protein
MSQRKLYIAYLGGEVFTRGAPWNPGCGRKPTAAMPTPSMRWPSCTATAGRGARRAGPGQAEPNLAGKAAAGAGQPHANLVLGRRQPAGQRDSGRSDPAADKLRQALDQLPAERYGPLWLYNARVRNGEAELARKELEASLDKQHDDDWPQPITRFYLGKMDAARVMREAADDKQLAQRRGCEAEAYMAEWHAARGEQGKADRN